MSIQFSPSRPHRPAQSEPCRSRASASPSRRTPASASVRSRQLSPREPEVSTAKGWMLAAIFNKEEVLGKKCFFVLPVRLRSGCSQNITNDKLSPSLLSFGFLTDPCREKKRKEGRKTSRALQRLRCRAEPRAAAELQVRSRWTLRTVGSAACRECRCLRVQCTPQLLLSYTF